MREVLGAALGRKPSAPQIERTFKPSGIANQVGRVRAFLGTAGILVGTRKGRWPSPPAVPPWSPGLSRSSNASCRDMLGYKSSPLFGRRLGDIVVRHDCGEKPAGKLC